MVSGQIEKVAVGSVEESDQWSVFSVQIEKVAVGSGSWKISVQWSVAVGKKVFSVQWQWAVLVINMNKRLPVTPYPFRPPDHNLDFKISSRRRTPSPGITYLIQIRNF